MAPLMGDTQECLALLAESFDRNVTRPILSEFSGVSRDTVARWLNRGDLPAGESLLKLRVFLDLVGYQVEELLLLPKVLRDLMAIMAFNIMTVEEVQKFLGFAKPQAVYRVLLRAEGTSSGKMHEVRRLVDSHEDEIKRVRALWQARVAHTLGISDGGLSAVVTPEIREVTDIVVIADHLVAALSSLLTDAGRSGRLAGAMLPDELRGRIHEQVGDDRILKLIEQLNMLL